MTTVRDALLAGVGGASETHDAFQVRDALVEGTRAVDVFGVIMELGIPLEFAPLDGLLGACLRVDETTVGILITTQRDLHMQRFTAAHELGHFVLQHEGSLDREVRFPGNTKNRDLREVEADAFAAEFLMPKWLVGAVANRHGWWSVPRLSDPSTVYQLSLRLALSYEATCWGLASHSCINIPIARALVETAPKESKLQLLEGVPLEDPWADVWQLDEHDNGASLDAGPTDLLVLRLKERVGAGYSWDTDAVMAAGFLVLEDRSEIDSRVVGAASTRRLVLRVPGPGTYDLRLAQRRRFSPKAAPVESFRVSVSTYGARKAGTYVASTASSLVLH